MIMDDVLFAHGTKWEHVPWPGIRHVLVLHVTTVHLRIGCDMTSWSRMVWRSLSEGLAIGMGS